MTTNKDTYIGEETVSFDMSEIAKITMNAISEHAQELHAVLDTETISVLFDDIILRLSTGVKA